LTEKVGFGGFLTWPRQLFMLDVNLPVQRIQVPCTSTYDPRHVGKDSFHITRQQTTTRTHEIFLVW